MYTQINIIKSYKGILLPTTLLVSMWNFGSNFVGI